jgi:hypothetical protein
MRTNPIAALAAVAVTLGALASPQASAQSADPSIPVGSLTAYPTIVQTGTKPTLTWSISYPSQVTTVVTVGTNGTVTPLRDLYVDLRVLGAQVGDGSNWYMVEAYRKLEGATSFTRFFRGKQTDVNPSTIYYTQLVRQSRPIDIRGRVASNSSSSPSSWQAYYSTGTTTKNVKALINGDSPPSYVPAFSNQTTIKSTLGPYIDSSGKIRIGPMDVIFIFELWGTDTSQSYFDMQDLVVLATFRIP